MYVPKHFKEDDQEKLHQFIRTNSFGMLVIADEEGIEANHVPFHLCIGANGSSRYLHCHLARNNPVWQRMLEGARVLVVFQGPNAYISPSWYPSKLETGRVVPTWNYIAVHVQGSARIIQDSSWLKQHLRQLTNQHEAEMAAPWSVDDAPRDFIEGLVQAIVGVEINIETLTGKVKASQNQPERNRAGVKAGLEALEGAQRPSMSELIR
jgi:transcriptional regulator